MTSLRDRIVLLAWTAASLWAFSSAYDTPAWIALGPAALSLGWQPRGISAVVQRGVSAFAWIVLAATTIVGLIGTIYPVLDTATERLAFFAMGWVLGGLCVIFLMSSRSWNPSATLIPSAMGLLVVACFRTQAPAPYAAIVIAGLAAFSFLAREQREPARLIPAAAGIFLVAWAIITWLPSAQKQVEQFASGMIADASQSGLGTESRLGDLQRLKLSKRVVMRVRTTRAQKLRGRVMQRFDGSSWKPGLPLVRTLTPAASADAGIVLAAVPGQLFRIADGDRRPREPILTRIIRSGPSDELLVAPDRKAFVIAPLDQLHVDAFENLTAPTGSSARIYGIVNDPGDDSVGPAADRPELVAEALALPENTDPRLRETAAQIGAGATTPAERVERTVRFVESAASYSLDVGPFRTRQPVAEFLFEKKRGYCQYFASAAAVLLRLQGVPARYVTGYNVTELNRQGDYYVVRDADAHAWVEAYVPGRGWIEVDATPADEYQSLHAGIQQGPFGRAWEWLVAHAGELWAIVRFGGWRTPLTLLATWVTAGARALVTYWSALALAGVLIALMAFARWRRRVAPKPASPTSSAGLSPLPPEVVELMSALDRAWADAGAARPVTRAPLEHAESLATKQISSELQTVSARIVDCFYRACFAGEVPASDEVHALRRALEPGPKDPACR